MAKAEKRRVVFEPPQQDGIARAPGPELDVLVLDVLDRVADKWTMCVLEVLHQHGVQRFTRVGELVGSISQRMLTKTLRQLEADGLVLRTVHAEVPPRVEYQLTEMGTSLCAAFCSLWLWAERHEPELRARRSRREDTL
ncbi:helix-turn-helix domain-containing protein [Massilia sp.]|uniref:winged helix-turn-helix transcriptional regulator n=1 Tax=Massilia sp. TaxID=1882437 RepID=UPI00289BA080|nr:helix-turn-helix domain-containing protein [Massilia sp.]